METVMKGSSPDIGKWSAAPTYARNYSTLAQQYVAISGDKTINIYDTDRLPNASSMTWPSQKSLFDAVYANVVMLGKSIAESKPEAAGPLFNLLVSGNENAWDGTPFQLELSRC